MELGAHSFALCVCVRGSKSSYLLLLLLLLFLLNYDLERT